MFSFSLRRAAALALCASIALTVTAAVPADAAGAVVIEGRGFGHGRGMSQWGARGMAERGATWRGIVAHYYRGTAVSKRRPGERIRVHVLSAPAVVVTSAQPFTLQWNDGTPIGVTDGRRRFVRVRSLGGRSVVEKSASVRGPWRRVMRSTRNVVFVRGRSPLQLVSESGAPRTYRGTISTRRRGASIDGINTLPLEEYLMGVVPREVPSTWPAEALRAQAVAARTYAVALTQNARGRAWDICSTTACQVYGGFAAERPRTTTAIFATARLVLTYRGKPIVSEYSSSSGGRTANGKRPYLVPVDDPADRLSPNHRWSRRIDASAIEQAFVGIGRLRSVTVRARDGGGEWGGRVRLVRIAGTRRTIDVPGGTFSARLNLRSRWYRVASPAGASYRFTTGIGRGSTGRAVTELQRRLAGFYRGPVNGVFDEATVRGLRGYQTSRRIRATGYLGPQTRARLNAEAARP